MINPLALIPFPVFILGAWVLWPIAALYALWRARRGLARAGWLGSLARILGGGLAQIAIGIALVIAFAPAVARQVIEPCVVNGPALCAEADGAILYPCGAPEDERRRFCNEEDMTFILPFTPTVVLAPGWVVLAALMKAGALIARRRPKRAA